MSTETKRSRVLQAPHEPIYQDAQLLRLQGVFEDIDVRKTLEVEGESPLREQKFVATKATAYDGQLSLSVTVNGTGTPTVEGKTPYEMFTRLYADVSGSG